MADKGFLIHYLVPKSVFLNLPPFLAGKSQLSKEAQFAKKIARCRIHVARSIERMRNYKILNLITAKLRPYCDKIVQFCAEMVNFQTPIINNVLSAYDDIL